MGVPLQSRGSDDVKKLRDLFLKKYGGRKTYSNSIALLINISLVISLREAEISLIRVLIKNCKTESTHKLPRIYSEQGFTGETEIL